MAAHLFISYSKKDSDFALKLAEDLISAGHEVWIDRSLEIGEDWADTIESNLEKATGVIVVLSLNAIESKWVQHEGSIAYGLKKRIYPVLIDDLPTEDLPLWVEKFQYHSFVDVAYQAAFDDLVSVLAPAINPVKILICVVAALSAGLVFGLIGGAITYFAFPDKEDPLFSITLGSMLVPGVWYSLPISFGIMIGETYRRKNKLLPIVGGSIFGMLSGVLLDLIIGEQIQQTVIGFICGGGIALSVIFGKRLKEVLRIPFWGLAGAFVGWVATISTDNSDRIPYILVSLGVTIAIGLFGSRD